jgi:3-hydroxyacyl-CoA dehydrogenase
MFAEGFDPIDFKMAEVLGTTGRAALEIIAVNSHEGLFISDETYELALKVASVICGGDVPKKTIIDEKQFLRLEAECFAETWKSKRNEVAI